VLHDYVIVGAGIAGASLAWRLAEHAGVLLLERESQPGYHSTGRSAAMFMESYGTQQVRALTRASRAFYTTPPTGFADARLLTPRGVLYLAQHGQELLLGAMLAELREGSAGVEHLDAGQVLARLPVARPDTLLGAIAEPDAQDIDVHGLHQGFLRGLRQRGAELWTQAELLGARHDGLAWTLQIAGEREARARVVVNAAGAWADVVAGLCSAAPVGLQPKRRSAFTFASPEGVDCRAWPTVAGIDESWYFKPDAGQLLGSPANADPVAPHDVVAEEIDIATGIAAIEAATTLTIRRPRHVWAGLRTFAADGDLVIGHDPECAGFFWLAGQGGYGIQSAAGAAQLAHALLIGAPLPQELAHHGVIPAAMSPQRLRGH
jgi:D-arginine dehydrogenase